MNEDQAYGAIHDAVFGVAGEAECSVFSLLGIIDVVMAELRSTIMEDAPAEDDFEEEELIG